jgi:uncharacterized protein (DUF488 family)
VWPGTLIFVGVVPAIWTVGHSNHSFERFAELLRGERIEGVVDVRSYPYSRIAPQFSREHLDEALRRIGVGYLFLGNELGGRPLTGCRARRLALLCSEGKPDECHRRLLVGKVLAESGVQLRHILPDGVVQQENSVSLAAKNGQESLFGEEAAWRSTRSVSHKRRLSTSSAA